MSAKGGGIHPKGAMDPARAVLRRAGLRATPQRVAALHALYTAAGRHLSAEEVWQELGQEPAMDRSTAYRVLADLLDAGLIVTARFADGVTRYEARSTTHHHAVCGRCGKTSDVRAEAVNDLAAELRREFGFVLGPASLLLEGQCRSCSSPGP